MKYLLAIAIFISSAALFAQDSGNNTPKVGLVLSGGGAKGFAHIGVLKVIEDAGVQLDYIAGTSMGAVVGSLYASGYRAHQIDSLFRSVNFDNIIQDNLPRSAKTFYERENSEKHVLELPFDNFKLSLPSSLSKGQNTYNLLTKNLAHVSEIEDFSQLPIPFLCIATDVAKGEQILLEKGYLPAAVSASGALPSLFSPVQLGEKLLIDGGVTNNYPIDELRSKGMDFIIGVDVQDTLRLKEELISASDVLIQINNYKTVRDMQRKKPETDIYIRPNIDAYSVVDFDSGAAIVEEGERVALEHMKELKSLALLQKGDTISSNSKPNNLRYNPIPTSQDSLTIDWISIQGNENYTRAYILGKLKLSPPVKTTYDKLNEGINNLSATGNFERIAHQVKQMSGEHNLHIQLSESRSTQTINLALHYDDLYRTAGLINFTKKRFLVKNDVLSFDFIIGDNIRYNLDYYIDKGFYWSVGARSTLTTYEQGINARTVEETRPIELAGINRLSLDFIDLTNKLYLQTLFVKQFALDLGIQHKFLDVETETVVAATEEENSFIFERSHLAGAYAQLKYDSLDNKYFPTSGIYFDGDFDLFLYSSDFNESFSEFGIANANFKYAFGISPKLSGVLELAGGLKIGADDDSFLDFFLGGFGAKKVNNQVPFLGYDFLGLAGDGYVKAAIDVNYELFPKNYVSLSGNFANVGYNIFTTANWLPPPRQTGYSIGYGVDTFLGPLQARYSYSPERNTGIGFISLGFQF